MNVRLADYADIPQILKLLEQVNLVHHEGRPDIFKRGVKYDEAELKGIIDDPSQLLLVAEDGQKELCGHAFCSFQSHPGSRLFTDIETLYVDDICVDRNHRRQNVGTLLYERVKAVARERGCYNITLNVWELNPGANAFYRKMGLVPLKTTLEEKL
ncbi:MAG: GNAT family N-acetyltransferase [Bacteroidales bacterium]|nr:GNAT family N-acetyltransferase [Bacteroidales bacterium]